MKTFRTDWADADDRTQVAYHHDDLAAARKDARKRSKTHGAAYVIISDAGQDQGQHVYYNGTFSHTDMVA